MTLDAYETALATTGVLKLKAQSQLAYGDADATFEACVLLQEAARGELRAVRLVEAPMATQLSALAEGCYCRLLARDPHGAAETWAQIVKHPLRKAEPEAAEAILRDLGDRVEKARLEYAMALVGLQSFHDGLVVPKTNAARKRAGTEVRKMLAAFPGVAQWWWVAYRLAATETRWGDAWQALERAHRLTPDEVRFEALLVLAAIEALDRRGARERIDAARFRLDSTRPLLCLTYALAELAYARGGKGVARRTAAWTRALDATRQGLVGARRTSIIRNLTATKLLAQSRLEGREPSLELLYEADLVQLALTATPGADVGDLLTNSVRLAVGGPR